MRQIRLTQGKRDEDVVNVWFAMIASLITIHDMKIERTFHHKGARPRPFINGAKPLIYPKEEILCARFARHSESGMMMWWMRGSP